MAIASWKPGTSRSAYLMTGVYAVAFAAGLPMTIVVNDDPAWLTFSCAMLGGVCNTTLAWHLRNHARRTTTSATAAAPQR